MQGPLLGGVLQEPCRPTAPAATSPLPARPCHCSPLALPLLLCPPAAPLLRLLQFYLHGLGITPTERRTRLGLALVMEAAVVLLAALELRQ